MIICVSNRKSISNNAKVSNRINGFTIGENRRKKLLSNPPLVTRYRDENNRL